MCQSVDLYIQAFKFCLQEADFALAALSVSAQRSTAIDYTAPFWVEATAVVVRKDPPTLRMDYYLAPFTVHVWGVLVASIITATAMLTFIQRYSLGSIPKEGTVVRLTAVSEHVVFFVGSFLQEGIQGDKLPSEVNSSLFAL